MPNIELEAVAGKPFRPDHIRAHRFYRPSRRSVDIYRETRRAIEEAARKAVKPSVERAARVVSVLLGVAIIGLAAQAYA